MHNEMRLIADICSASRAAGLAPRSDIAKCNGSLDDYAMRCVSCVRILAPDGVGQQRMAPEVSGENCAQFASLEHYGHLFVPATAPAADREVL